MQPRGIDHLAGALWCYSANRGNPAATHANVCLARPIVIDKRSALDHQIECFCHSPHQLIGAKSLASCLMPAVRLNKPVTGCKESNSHGAM
jgi:hypothetical protein